MLPGLPGQSLLKSLSIPVVLLPVLILLLGAAMAALSGRRTRSFQWGIPPAAALAAWVAALLAAGAVPEQSSLSAWRPENIFPDPIRLMLDAVGWPIQLASLSALLAVLLSGQSVNGDGAPRQATWSLAYAAAGLLALQAGNLLTVALSWTILDLAGTGLPIRRGADTERLYIPEGLPEVNSAGILLVLASVLALPPGAAKSTLAGVGSSGPAALLFLGGVGLRSISAWQTPARKSSPETTGGERSLRWLLPSAVGVAALGRVLGSPEGVLVEWTAVAGGLACALGTLGWLLAPRVEDGLPRLVLGIGGVGALGAAANPANAAVAWSSAGVLVLLIGVMVIVWRPYSRGQRMILGLGTLALAGFPFTPGGLLASILTSGGGGTLRAVAGWIGLLGMAAMAVRLGAHLRVPQEEWPRIEPWRKAAYVLGLTVPIATLVWTYAFLRSEQVGAGLMGPAVGLGMFALGTVLRTRLPALRPGRGGRALRWLDPAPILNAAGAPLRAVRSGIDRVGELLEGEAAMLWIYVLVVALGLAAAAGR
jgi:hypothetical protein